MISKQLKDALVWLRDINRSRRKFYVGKSRRVKTLIQKRNIYGVVYDFDIDAFTPCEELLLAMTRKLYSLARHKVTTLAAEEGFRIMWDSNNAPILLKHMEAINAMEVERKRVGPMEVFTRLRYLQIRRQELEQEFPDIKVQDIVRYEE